MILDLKGLRAKVSKKNVILSTRKDHGLRLAKHYAKLGVSTSVKPKAKYLGLGTTGGARRTTATIKDRMRSAKSRSNKVAWSNKKNKRARTLHTTGVLPQASYGSQGTGFAPWMIRSLRTMGADGRGCSKQGRCPITAIALAKGLQGDPYIRGPMQVFKHWAAISAKIEPNALQEAWQKMEQHVFTLGGKAWARVKGPMAATFMHLREMGWTAHFGDQGHDGFMDKEGVLWKFNHEISWQDFEEHTLEIREAQLWTQASGHRGGLGMKDGVDMSVSVSHYNRLVKKGQTDKAAALASITSGALWCPARLEEAGIPHAWGKWHISDHFVEPTPPMKATSSGNAPRCCKAKT